MIRTCPKCGDFYADTSLAFCLVDGAPLIGVEQESELWSKGSRVIEEKESALRNRRRKLKWRRIFVSATTMVIVSLVVCVLAINSLIYLRPKQPEEGVTSRTELTPRDATPTSSPESAETPDPVKSQNANQTVTPTPTPACSGADMAREREFISKEFGAAWRREIEEERDAVLARSLPALAENVQADLSPLGFESTLDDACTSASFTVSYLWEVKFNLNGASTVVPIRGQKKFGCVKTEGVWRCSQPKF